MKHSCPHCLREMTPKYIYVGFIRCKTYMYECTYCNARTVKEFLDKEEE